MDAVRNWVASDVGSSGVTFSAGVAAWDGDESLDSLILRADTNLYRVKSDGRNRVVGTSAGTPDGLPTEGPGEARRLPS